MKLLSFKDWVDEYGMGELEEYQIELEQEDDGYELSEYEENEWLSNAYEDYISYAEDRTYDEWKEKG